MNRLTSAVNVASYAYDGLGRRSWAQMANGRTVLRVYSQDGRLLFTNDSLKGATRHVHLGDKVVAETNTLSGTRWLHSDALGSPVAITGPAGQLLDRTRYEPYGLTAAGTNPDGIGFTGHVNDVDTGLVYMQQRYYDPVAGRFLSVDPVTTDAGNGALFNRYMYAANNPYTFGDRDGRCAGSRLVNLDGTCMSTGGFSTGSAGVAQGMQIARAVSSEFAQAARGAANLTGMIAEKLGRTPLGLALRVMSVMLSGGADSGDKDSSTPTGQRGSPIEVKPGTNEPTSIGGRDYSGHALDRVPGRGVPPSAIEDAIQNSTPSPGNTPGTTVHTGSNGVTVVTGNGGRVVTVIPR